MVLHVVKFGNSDKELLSRSGDTIEDSNGKQVEIKVSTDSVFNEF